MTGLRQRLKDVGVKRKFLDEVVLPSWWEDSIAESQAGFREGAGYICSHIGYSLESLLDGRKKPTFAGASEVKFKKSEGVGNREVALATNYALGLARAVTLAADDLLAYSTVPAPLELREELLNASEKKWISLRDILASCWRRGIPVIQIRNFPKSGKKPDALVTIINERPVIAILKNVRAPSSVAFILAHELGHLYHEHVKPGQTVVDEEILEKATEEEEQQANQFALELLTGDPAFSLRTGQNLTTKHLVAAAKKFGETNRVAPGVCALNHGYRFDTRWPVANGAVKMLEGDRDAGEAVAQAMTKNLSLDEVSDDTKEWIIRATKSDEG